MPFDGAGVFTQIYNWVTDKANAVLITASRFEATYEDMATALSNCMTRDGQSPPTANIPMGAKKITGLAAGVASTDAVNVGQVPALAGAETFFDAGNSGVALSIDWVTNGRNQGFTLTGNATVTLGSPTTPGWYTLKIAQDATGGRTITWAGAGYSAARWIGNGAAPVLSGVASGVEYLRLFWDGTVLWQVHLGPAARRNTYTTKVSRATSNQSTTAGVLTKIQFNSSDIDPYTEWDLVTNYRWTPKVTGLYFVTLQVSSFDASADSQLIFVLVGGVSVAVAAANFGTNQGTRVIAIPVNVTSLGQYVEAYLTSNTGAGTIVLGATITMMTVSRLGDAT